ncbi:MAG: STAS domain-containing protein [Burkholderiales bacterium]|nr:STAS domain-containing protein [Burkholderiales bacterium]
MLSLPQELTHAAANACLEQLTRGLASEAEKVVVDAQALQRFDSSALAVLLEFRRVCARQGKSLLVQGLPAHLLDLASLYGVEDLVPRA